MKILIKGYYGFGNLGDDILMITAFRVLKEQYPEAHFYIFSNFNQNLKSFNRIPDYNRYINNLLDENVTIIDWTFKGTFDLLVDGGGGVYFDNREGSWINKAINVFLRRTSVHALYGLDNFLRKITRKPRHVTFSRRIGFGLGIGTYSPGAPLFYRHKVEIGSYHAIFVRDEASVSLLRDFKFARNQYLFTDIAFLKQYWLPESFILPKKNTFKGAIGIILMNWEAENGRRFDEFKKFVEAKRKEYQITFFSLDENYDKKYIESFESQFPFIRWQPDKQPLQQFLQSLAVQDILITGRAHGAIIGAQLGVIPVCLGTSQKLVEVSKMFPMSSKLIPEPLQYKTLVECVDNIKLNVDEMRQRLEHDNIVNQRKAMESVRQLRELI